MAEAGTLATVILGVDTQDDPHVQIGKVAGAPPGGG